jgi:hypothetical protein
LAKGIAKISLVVLLLVVFGIFVLKVWPIVAQGESRASIWTDKEDYSSEETVTIYGSGFLANANVTITITAPNSSVAIIYAMTDDSGNFTAEYKLNGMEGTYNVTATDGTNTATTTFAESPGLKVDATWTDHDCANIEATASGLSTSKSYYVTYTDPDGNVQRTSPTYTGTGSFKDYLVLDITLPKVLGTWTVKLYEVGDTNPKDTDTVTINRMVWTTDSTYAVMKTSFAQGETVYIKAIGLLTNKYYRFMLQPPTGSNIYVGTWTTGVSELTGSYNLPITAPTGSWEVHVRQANNAGGGGETHYVDRYFNVTAALPTTETNCNDNIDNDGDQLTDCSDPDCAGTQPCFYNRPCGEGIDICKWDKVLPLGSPNCCGCNLGYNTYWPLGTDNSATCTFNGDPAKSQRLYISINNDILECKLNGNVIFSNQQHEGCAEADPRNGYVVDISQYVVSGQNMLVCTMRDRGGTYPYNMDHFDACVIEKECFDDTTGPTTFNVQVNPIPPKYDPVKDKYLTNFTATISDTCSNITAAEYFVRKSRYCGPAGTGNQMQPVDGSFNELTEDVIAQHEFSGGDDGWW